MDSIYVDRESHNEVNIRMMTLHRTHREGDTRIGFRMKRRITQERVKGHLQDGEREPDGISGGSGRSGHTQGLGEITSGWCDAGSNRLWMNRSGDHRKSCHGRAGSTKSSWIAAKRTGSTVFTVLPFFVSCQVVVVSCARFCFL